MKNTIVVNTKNEECPVRIGSHAIMSLGNGVCTPCVTYRIFENGTVVFKLDDKPNSYKSFKSGEQVPFAYL